MVDLLTSGKLEGADAPCDSLSLNELDTRRFGWRPFRDAALVVSSSDDRIRVRNDTGDGAARMRAVGEIWELFEEIGRDSRARTLSIGGGYLVRSPSGQLSLLRAEAAALWRSLEEETHTYCEILDGVAERRDLDCARAEAVVRPLLLDLAARELLSGLEHVAEFRPREEHRTSWASEPWSQGGRDLGRIEAALPASRPASPPTLGLSPILRQPTGPVEHVAVVCQYGIHGIAAGVDGYTRSCVEQLRDLAPDLVVISGGGRHGLTREREAESVAERFLALLPDPGLWLEKHSSTTWENLLFSLEILGASGIAPRRLSFVGDRLRREKMRLSCSIARRHVPAFATTRFEVVPLRRERATWRDRRLVQALLGTVQIFRESRGLRSGQIVVTGGAHN